MERPWSKPITIALEAPDQWVEIATTQAAAWAMIEDWPTEDGEALDKALAVCEAVISNKRTPEDARRAFLAAVIEAGIPMKSE